VNLGSPDSPNVGDVRRYLAEFLMDECVLDVPWLLRAFIVYGTILPRRPTDSAAAYATVWTEEGSPLVVISKQVQALVQARVNFPVGLAMRYGNPSIRDELSRLKSENPDLKTLRVIPLYPHYAMSSYETVVRKVQGELARLGWTVDVSFQPPFYSESAYIKALVASVNGVSFSDFDHVLVSYHGLPERHLRKSDPTGAHCLAVPGCCDQPSVAHETCYRHQVYRTTQLFAQHMGFAPDFYSVSFQSRLGRDPWLTPYTDFVVKELAERGIKRLAVISPAFVSDCLETIEELGDRARHDFLAAGGESFTLIPCLNTTEAWIDALEGHATQK
jgi:protoporphyrin/coproporphyrin ferrochelatase